MVGNSCLGYMKIKRIKPHKSGGDESGKMRELRPETTDRRRPDLPGVHRPDTKTVGGVEKLEKTEGR